MLWKSARSLGAELRRMQLLDTTLAGFRGGSRCEPLITPRETIRSQPPVTDCCMCAVRRAAAHVLARHRAGYLQVPLPPLLGHCAAAAGRSQHGAGSSLSMVSKK